MLIDRDSKVLFSQNFTSYHLLINHVGETISHSLLAQHDLAPPLLARFQNGLMYRFIPGQVCSSADLTREAVWKGVARRLAEWHAILPIIAAEPTEERSYDQEEITMAFSPAKAIPLDAEINAITPNKATPNIWTVMQKWILALPIGSIAQQNRKAVLQQELKRTVAELGDTPGLGKDGVRPSLLTFLRVSFFKQSPSSSLATVTSCPAT